MWKVATLGQLACLLLACIGVGLVSVNDVQVRQSNEPYSYKRINLLPPPTPTPTPTATPYPDPNPDLR